MDYWKLKLSSNQLKVHDLATITKEQRMMEEFKMLKEENPKIALTLSKSRDVEKIQHSV